MFKSKYSLKTFFVSSILLFLQKKTRKAFSIYEFTSLLRTACYYLFANKDPEYNGKYQKKLEYEFQSYLGGGYSKVVNSGTNAIYIALKSLGLKERSYIAVTPLIDPGVINAILISGNVPYFIDYEDKYKPVLSNIDFFKKSKVDIAGIIIVHYYGYISTKDEIINYCKKKGIKIIEDCSQCHGGRNKNGSIGREGDISVFSTMSRKSMITGSSGGILFTKNQDTYNLIQSYSDRGKPANAISTRDCSKNLFPSLNFNTCELNCSIGLSSLKRLNKSTSIRRKNTLIIQKEINSKKDLFSPKFKQDECPFVIPLFCMNNNKDLLIHYLKKYNLDFSTEFFQCATKWPWLKNYIDKNSFEECKNAEFFADNHILIYIHEGYNFFYIKSLIQAIRSFRRSSKK